jgi:hypothetical protein
MEKSRVPAREKEKIACSSTSRGGEFKRQEETKALKLM